MTDTVSVYNLALSHCGIGVEVQATTENTTAANACRRFFEQARDELLTDFPWPFARKVDTLALVEDDPTTEWAFSYRYPSDCLRVRRILGTVRNESRTDRVPYEIARDDSGLLIYTDWEDETNGAQLEYTVRVSDPTYWPAPFVRALAYLLASYIIMRVSSGDPASLRKTSISLAQMAKDWAQADSLNEQQDEMLPESEFITDRDA